MWDMTHKTQTQTHSHPDSDRGNVPVDDPAFSPANSPVASPVRASRRLTAAVLAGGLAATLGAALWYSTRSGSLPPPVSEITVAPVAASPASPAVPASPAPARWLTVHVSGAVAAPGLVAVADGSRVADAIEAAGGVRPGAGFGSINLAAEVRDGMQLVVPWAGEATAGAGSGAGASVTGDGKVDINRAGVTDMTRLPGVGEVIATRIVSHREANGPFRTVEDLLDVPGIGEGKLAAIRDYALVG